jgi:hypothetical protein
VSTANTRLAHSNEGAYCTNTREKAGVHDEKHLLNVSSPPDGVCRVKAYKTVDDIVTVPKASTRLVEEDHHSKGDSNIRRRAESINEL